MDFFYYADLLWQFPTAPLWSQMLVGALCFAIVYVLQAFGLYTIACKNGYNLKWMAFIPFFNTFYIGYVSRKNRCFKWLSTTVLAIIVTVVEIFLVAGYVLLTVATQQVKDFIPTETFYGTTVRAGLIRLDTLPQSLYWAGWVDSHLIDIISPVYFVFRIAKLFLLITFFQTYAARRYFIFSIFSVLFPIQGIIIFVVRNNKGLNYQDYIRAEQERRYRMYQQYQQQQFTQDDYRNPYSRNPEPPRNPPSGDPFDGAGEKKPSDDDPFDGLGKQ